MKLIVSAFATLGLLGALPALTTEDAGEPSFSRPAQEHKESLLRYHLQVSGSSGSCEVGKSAGTDGVRAELELGGDCAKLMPRLSEARYWQERETGEVVFVSADGQPIVEFFPGDGVAYESLRPASPLIALIAK